MPQRRRRLHGAGRAGLGVGEGKTEGCALEVGERRGGGGVEGIEVQQLDLRGGTTLFQSSASNFKGLGTKSPES